METEEVVVAADAGDVTLSFWGGPVDLAYTPLGGRRGGFPPQIDEANLSIIHRDRLWT